MAELSLVGAFAALGGAVGVVGTVPYARDVWRRTTVPHRGSWFIWCVIEVVSVEAQRADGASWSTLPLGVQALGTGVVFGLSLRLGVGGLSRTELILMAVAGIGVLGWFAADEPVIATGGAIVADFVGVVLMVPKAWRQPHSETLSMFGLAAVGGVLTAASVGAPTPGLLVYPVYFALVNGLVAWLLWHRRAVVARPTEVVHRSSAGVAVRTGVR